MSAAEAALLGLTLALAGCRREASEAPATQHEGEAPRAIEHGPAMPYAGTWVGPALRLEFGGRWVLVEPAERAPGQAPIELRVAIERREGEAAFALLVAIAGAMPADFLRPGDWTLLVEPGALALAMGDEPLESYVRVDAPPALIGPALVEPSELPETLAFEVGIACLELAGTLADAYEREGPRALGLREALWAECIARPQGLDPRAEPAERAPMRLAMQLAALRWSSAVVAAASDQQRAASEALHARVIAAARELIGELDPTLVSPTREAIVDHLQAADR